MRKLNVKYISKKILAKKLSKSKLDVKRAYGSIQHVIRHKIPDIPVLMKYKKRTDS